jgi:hypothetical protein
MHASTEDKCDDTKDSFYEELDRVFYPFPKYHMNILFGDFNAKVGGGGIFKPTIENDRLHKTSKENRVRVANFSTTRNLVVMTKMFPHCNIHKHTSPDGNTRNQID